MSDLNDTVTLLELTERVKEDTPEGQDEAKRNLETASEAVEKVSKSLQDCPGAPNKTAAAMGRVLIHSLKAMAALGLDPLGCIILGNLSEPDGHPMSPMPETVA